MLNVNWWKRLAAVGCLFACVGCPEKRVDSGASEGPAANAKSTKTAPMLGRADLKAPGLPPAQQTEAASIYKAAVPELREFDWKFTRTFNLALNNPPHVRPAKADFMRAEDIVLGVVLGDEARAYPWILMANFHAANDQLDGQPIIVNVCEACNGGAAFLATLPETVIDLRPRGLKNGTWYGVDFQTESLWYPFIGEAYEGPLKGTKLTRIRAYFSSWRDWVRDHPNTTVAVSSDEVRFRPHGRASKMAHESTFNEAFLKRITDPKPNPKRDLLPGYTLVFGLIPSEGDKPKAFTLKTLGNSETLIQTTIDSTPIVLMLQNQYQIGAYHRLLNGTELDLKVTSKSLLDPLVFADQLGNEWNMWGRTIKGPNHPSELALVDGYMAKWYEWVENFPDTELVDTE